MNSGGSLRRAVRIYVANDTISVVQEFMENFRKLREEEESKVAVKVKAEEAKEEADVESEDVSHDIVAWTDVVILSSLSAFAQVYLSFGTHGLQWCKQVLREK